MKFWAERFHFFKIFAILKPLQGLPVWSSPGDLSQGVSPSPRDAFCAVLDLRGIFLEPSPPLPAVPGGFPRPCQRPEDALHHFRRPRAPSSQRPSTKPQHGPRPLLLKPLQSRFFSRFLHFLHPLSSIFFLFFFFWSRCWGCFAPSRSTLCAHTARNTSPCQKLLRRAGFWGGKAIFATAGTLLRPVTTAPACPLELRHETGQNPWISVLRCVASFPPLLAGEARGNLGHGFAPKVLAQLGRKSNTRGFAAHPPCSPPTEPLGELRFDDAEK